MVFNFNIATMFKLRSVIGHGVAGEQGLLFSLLHSFWHLMLYSTSSSSPQLIAEHLVRSLSFSQQQALSISDKLAQCRQRRGSKEVSDLKTIHNADSVVKFLKQYGFDQSRIRNVITCWPPILASRVDKTLKPKFEALHKHGLTNSELALILSENPEILVSSFNSRVLPAIRALSEILSNDGVVEIIKRLKGFRSGDIGSVANYLLPNVGLLRKYGIPMELIRKYLVAKPRAFVVRHECFEDMLIRVEENLGISRSTKMFLDGVILLASNSEKMIESKLEVFKSFGWTQTDILEMMKRNPHCFGKSKETTTETLNFLMKEVGYEPKYITTRVSLLTCSLEGRILPRYRTWMFLKEKGLIEKHYALYTIVLLSELKFVERFVLPFKEVHKFYAKQKGVSVRLLTQGA